MEKNWLKNIKVLIEEERKLQEEEEIEEENNKGGQGLFPIKPCFSIIVALIIALILVILIYNIGLLNNSMNEME